jgi:hypothetical protein
MLMNEEAEELEEDVSLTSLIILGDELNPQDLTVILGLEPEYSWRKDDAVPDSDYSYHGGGWKCYIPSENQDLEVGDQLNWWCQLLESKASFLRSFEGKDFQWEINCFATSGLEIKPNVLERMSKLRLGLIVLINLRWFNFSREKTLCKMRG